MQLSEEVLFDSEVRLGMCILLSSISVMKIAPIPRTRKSFTSLRVHFGYWS